MYKFVFVDIDGVLRDFVAKMKEIFLLDFPDHKIVREDCYDLRNWTSKGHEIFPWVIEGKSAEIIFTQAPVHPESISAFQSWIAKMNGVFPKFAIVTHQKGDRIIWTRKWLTEHSILGKIPVYYTVEKTKVMLSVLKEHSLKHNLDITPAECVFLDDNPVELAEASAAGFNVICVDSSWNQEWQGKRIKNLSEFDPFKGTL
jgi:hypothetical protein